MADKFVTRLVLNHSTFVPGLLPILQKITKSGFFGTIIPGRLHTTRTGHGKVLELRVCAKESDNNNNDDTNKSNSVRVLARSGSNAQEVYFIPRPLNVSVLTNENTPPTVNKANGKNNNQEKYFNKSSIFSSKYSNKLNNYSPNNSNSNDNKENSKNNDLCSSKIFGSQLRELLVGVACTVTVYPAKSKDNQPIDSADTSLTARNSTRKLGGRASCDSNLKNKRDKDREKEFFSMGWLA
mmetsp:Transcript_7783/g.7860  ORF Transcript_7783/g.7860 Transcript_7783/m.7860 type:complete len:239 (+) Transcript_7783:83-799(+)